MNVFIHFNLVMQVKNQYFINLNNIHKCVLQISRMGFYVSLKLVGKAVKWELPILDVWE